MSYLPTSSFISWLCRTTTSKGDFEVSKKCVIDPLASLCASFYHFLMSPFSKCSDALISILAVTTHLVLIVSQVPS